MTKSSNPDPERKAHRIPHSGGANPERAGLHIPHNGGPKDVKVDVHYLTRVEGHGDITVDVRAGDGQRAEAEMASLGAQFITLDGLDA